MIHNPLRELETLGQSVWMDFIHRGAITSGELQRLVVEDGVSGVTTNPSIFERAIAESHDYDEEIRTLALEGKNKQEIYESLAIADVQMVADLLRPTYDRTDGRDGFVSLEVSPRLAYDTAGTTDEARRLWALVDRPNSMIKVPATPEGIPAIRQLTAEGINVNVTLLFGISRYAQAVDAYIAGLEARAVKGNDLSRVASVASFFLSRIDSALDPKFEEMTLAGRLQADDAALFNGQVGIASAKAAYQMHQAYFESERFRMVADRGARAQRLLWASTSTKNPAQSDIKYVEPLIGQGTINTLTLETLAAYRDHGKPKLRLERNVSMAYRILNHLSFVGVNLKEVAQRLEDEGVQKFVAASDRLTQVIEEKVAVAREPVVK